MKWLTLPLILFAATATAARPARAFVFTTNSTGTSLRWDAPVKPVFYANWSNSDLLGYSQVFNMFTNSLQRWRNVGSAAVDFEYRQGVSTPALWALDGRNTIFFQSKGPLYQQLGASTIGVTYVYSSGGRIIEADVEFNDDNFNFTTNPTDSTRFGSGTNVFLENVATHELGHAYGLSHSAVLQSSMIFLEDRGQSKPSCDDIQGLGAAYPSSSFSSGRGSISGTIDDGGTSVFGAHVLAISKARGAVVAGAITASDGSFTVPNLEPGEYYLMIEPFQTTAPLSALCGGVAAGCAYGAINSATICSGSTAPFKRQFYESASGTLQEVTVASNAIAAIGAISVGCSAMVDPWGGAADSLVTAPTILANNVGEVRAAVRGQIAAAGGSQYYLLDNVTGDISVKVLSYGLYSPIDAQVSLVDGSGASVSGSTVTPNVFSNSSSYVNYDANATLASATPASYYVKVTHAGSLNSRLYPAGDVSSQVDAVPYYLVIVTIDDSSTFLPTSANPLLADNARCESVDSFSAYPDLGPGPNPSTGTDSGGGGRGESGIGGAAGCGFISRHGSGRGPGPETLFSAWGVLVMLGIGRLLQRLASRRVAR